METSDPDGTSVTDRDDGQPGTPARRTGVLPVGVTAASLVLPGLGQLVLGDRRSALFFLVPSLVVLAALTLWALANGVYGIVAALVVPGALMMAFAGNLLVAGWRAAAALQALWRSRPGRAAGAVSVLLVASPSGCRTSPPARSSCPRTISSTRRSRWRRLTRRSPSRRTSRTCRRRHHRRPSPRARRRRPTRRPRRPPRSRRIPRTAATAHCPPSTPRCHGSGRASCHGGTTAGSICC